MNKKVESSFDEFWVAPNWRQRRIEKFIACIAQAEVEKVALADVMASESDFIIKYGLRIFCNKPACGAEEYRLAAYYLENNSKTRLASMIRSMLVADRSSYEIAEALRVSQKSVLIFSKLYFDLAHPRFSEAWLKRAALEPELWASSSEVDEVERRCLRIAFLHGWKGLSEELGFSQRTASPDENFRLGQDVQKRVLQMTLSHYEAADQAGLAMGPADVKQAMDIVRTVSRIAQPAASKNSWLTFIQGLHGAVITKAEERLSEIEVPERSLEDVDRENAFHEIQKSALEQYYKLHPEAEAKVNEFYDWRTERSKKSNELAKTLTPLANAEAVKLKHDLELLAKPVEMMQSKRRRLQLV